MTDKSNGWLRILAIVIPYFIFVGLFELLGALIAGVHLTDFDAQLTSLQDTILSFFSLLGTSFVLWVFMKYVDKEKFIYLGLSTKGRIEEFNAGFFIGGLVMALAYVLLVFMDEIRFKEIVFEPKEIIYSILTYTFVSISEEMLARGYVLKNLMLSFNKYIALIVSSLIFAMLHLANPNMDWFSFFGLFSAGILLGISYIYTKNLWFPIGLHLSWNLFQSLFGFNVSGQDFYSLIEFNITDKNRLNGGDFGFEGSIFSVIFEVLIIISIWIYYHKKRNKKTVEV